jgi:serine-type D-Ala-D-Ala carboxypeptidase
MGEAARVDQLLGTLDARARAAQVVAVAISPTMSQPDTLPTALNGIGGVWIEGGDAAAVRRLSTALRSRPGVPPFIAADVDEGLGGIIGGTTRFPPVHQVLPSAAEEDLDSLGLLIAREAKAIGVDFGFVRAPPTAGGGVYARGNAFHVPDRFGRFLESSREGGLPLAIRLFWSADTSSTVAAWDRGRLDAIELPMLDAADAAVALVPGQVSLPSLAGDTIPLPYSAASHAVLRAELGWDRPVVADLREIADTGTDVLAVRALAAGADIVVVRGGAASVIAAIERAVLDGTMEGQRLDDAVRRVLRLKLDNVLPEAGVDSAGPPPDPPSLAEGAAFAERLARSLPRAHLLADDSLGSARPPGGAPTLRLVEAAEVGMSEDGLAEADEAIEEAIDDSVFTAAALVVARQGGLVRFRGYTGADSTAGVDPQTTLFDLASLTKIVGTTTAAALLLDSGDLELDAPVQRYVREFRGDGRGEITIRHLLSHTSGLAAGSWLYGSATSSEEALEQVIGQSPRRRPGEAVEYSDFGMILLAEVIQRTAGRPIDQLLAARLFAPLDMSSTMYLPPAYLHDRAVPSASDTERPFPLQGVVHDGNAFRLGGIAGHAGLFSTARDLAIFSQMMLNRGSYGSARILSAELVDTLTARQENAEERALGWDTPADRSSAGRYFSSRSYGHTGYTGTSIWIDPLRELFVVLLTNRTYTGAEAGEILDLRIDVHEAAVRAITDFEVSRRRGSR